MKLVLSADSVKFPLTGIGRYTHELMLALEQTGSIDDFKLLNRLSITDTKEFQNWTIAQ